MTQEGSSRRAWAGAVVWTVWLVMTGCAAVFVARYSHGLIPFADEWTLLPVISGERAVTLDWLWAPHNEHRILLPRLVYLGVGWATGYDFRRMAQFNVVLLAALAAALIGAARAVRGRTTVGDAVFPLALLHAGHHANLLYAFQLCFVLSATLSTLALVPIVLGRSLTPARAAGLTICMLGAEACGANGICFGLPMGAWLLLTAVCDRRQPGVRPWGLCAAAAILAGFVGLYFRGYAMPSHHVRPPGVWACARTALEFVATSLGPAGKGLWPLSAVLIAGALAAVTGHQMVVWLRRPEERTRVTGLLAFTAGMTILALGVGWGRSAVGPEAGFAERYTTLTAPLLVVFSLHVMLYVSPPWAAHAERVMVGLLVAVALIGFHKGVRNEQRIGGDVENLVDDMRRGLAPAAMALRHGDRLAFSALDEFADRLANLRRARMGPYREALPVERPDGVRRIAELADRLEGPHWESVGQGQTRRQSFALQRGERLARIDLQWWPQGSRWAHGLDWRLEEPARAGPRKTLAAGRIDGDRDVRGQYSMLNMRPDIDGPKQLELVVGPAESRPAWVPVYRAAGAGPAVLRAFLFVSPGGQ